MRHAYNICNITICWGRWGWLYFFLYNRSSHPPAAPFKMHVHATDPQQNALNLHSIVSVSRIVCSKWMCTTTLRYFNKYSLLLVIFIGAKKMSVKTYSPYNSYHGVIIVTRQLQVKTTPLRIEIYYRKNNWTHPLRGSCKFATRRSYFTRC